MQVSFLCTSGCADDSLIEPLLLLVLQSNLNIPHAMPTWMQCLHVDSTVRFQADEVPEYCYIMLFAAESDPWTNKPLLSNLRLRHTGKPEFRYIMPLLLMGPSCFAHGFPMQFKLCWNAFDRNLQLCAVPHSPATV